MDSAGFYLCWGCLAWIPSVYCIHSTYLAFHPEFATNNVVLGVILVIGVLSILINYKIDA